MMSDIPRQTLRHIIAKYGHDLCSDAARCEGLLRDLCGAHRREINIIVSALKERVPLDLLAGRTMPRELLFTSLARRLEDHLAITGDAARWAVDSWALALGLVTEAEVEESEKDRVKAAPPLSPAAASGPKHPGDSRRATEIDTGPPPPSPPPRPQPKQQTQGVAPPPVRPVAPPPSRPSTGNASHGRPTIIPPAARPHAAPLTPLAGSPRAPAPAPSGNATRAQAPSFDPAARKRPRKLRGCMVGCFLFVLLSLILFFGAPYVVSLLREEQRQQNIEPTRAP